MEGGEQAGIGQQMLCEPERREKEEEEEEGKLKMTSVARRRFFFLQSVILDFRLLAGRRMMMAHPSRLRVASKQYLLLHYWDPYDLYASSPWPIRMLS